MSSCITLNPFISFYKTNTKRLYTLSNIYLRDNYCQGVTYVKKKIVIGCCLATFIMLMLPSISAINANTISEEELNNEYLPQSENGPLMRFLEHLKYLFVNSPIALLLRYIFSFLFFTPEKI